ncbi:MAG: ABC transporter substrate-binding protein, partial [Comamonas sp.]|nr:ABC transporter substrate-binding protein [Comamonas sp.]
MPTSRSLWSPALLAAACALSAHSQAAGAPDMLRVALHADIASVNPGVNRDANSDMVMAHVVEGLVAYGEDLTIKPMLASSWKANDDSTSYDFKLRPNVRFHNGKTLSAADVAWNFKRYLDPKTNFQCINRYNGKIGPALQEVKAVDAQTVRFSFSAPAPNFLMTLATIQCTPWIIHPDSVAANGSVSQVIGTGPYSFAEKQTGRYTELKRFADYSALPGARDGYAGNKQASIATLRFVTVPDASTRSNGVLSRDLDVIDDVDPDTIKVLKDKGVQVEVQPTPSWVVLQVQTEAPALKDVRMRQAIAKALSLPDVAEAAGKGLFTANPSVISPLSPSYDQRSKAWPGYDP